MINIRIVDLAYLWQRERRKRGEGGPIHQNTIYLRGRKESQNSTNTEREYRSFSRGEGEGRKREGGRK